MNTRTRALRNRLIAFWAASAVAACDRTAELMPGDATTPVDATMSDARNDAATTTDAARGMDVATTTDVAATTTDTGPSCVGVCTLNAECQSSCAAPPARSVECCFGGGCELQAGSECAPDDAGTGPAGTIMCTGLSCGGPEDCIGCIEDPACCSGGQCAALVDRRCPSGTDAGDDH